MRCGTGAHTRQVPINHPLNPPFTDDPSFRSDAPLSRDDEGENASNMLAMFIDRCHRVDNYHPEDWELALIKKEPVGVVVPAYLDDRRDSAGNLYVRVIPIMRGQGFGRLLHYRGLEIISKRGVRNYLSSCDCLNLPMIKIFESLNYRLVAIQHYFKPNAL